MHTKQKTKLVIADTVNAQHYQWGVECEGWHLLKSENLSIVKETMPADTTEKIHFHEKAQQFFYILSGIATFDIDGEKFIVKTNQGIRIAPGVPHLIANNNITALEFLVVSEPKIQDDRVEIDLFYPRK